MGKKYKPRELDESQNPFLQELVIDVVEHYDMRVLSDVSKIESSDGVITSLGGDTVTKQVTFFTERDKYVVEYGSYGDMDLEAVRNGLSGGALRMYDYVKQSLKKNKTFVHIDSGEYMKKYGVKSYTTFVSHRKELVNARIITPSSEAFQGWYWVNPAFVFYGSRMIAFKDKKEVKLTVKKK